MLKADFAERIKRLPPYLFAEIQEILQEKRQAGKEVISLSIGDPDLPPPPIILESLKKEAADPTAHGYSSSRGEPEFRETVSEWMKGRFQVDITPEEEVAALLGSKEGIANVARAFINPGDHALVPNPAYPVYENGGVLLSGGVPVSMPLLKENNFLPDLESIEDSDAKMMFLNFPNNPTGAIATEDFLKRCIDFALENDIILCYDNAYSEITYEGYTAPSILEIEGAKEVAIEFHSCSKTFNMTGWRIAFAVGNKDAIQGLGAIKSNLDSGVFQAIQIAGIEALTSYQNDTSEMAKIYEHRRDIMVKGLRDSGFHLHSPKATFYLWVPVPHPYTSTNLATRLLDEAGVVVTPGNGFGAAGDGYIRIALTQDENRLSEAVERIHRVGL